MQASSGRSVVRPETAEIAAPTSGSSWAALYRAGGWAAFAYVALVVAPVVLVFAAPVPPTDAPALLDYIADHKAVYLTELVCFVGLSIPALVVFTALAVALWHHRRALAVIGGMFGVVSETIALALGSSPQSLHGGLVVLSNSYATAHSEAERAKLVSAAESLIASTNAVTWAGILTAAAIVILSWAMRGAAAFGRGVALLGIVTGAAGLVSEVLRPVIGPAYLVYGLLLPMWFALVGWQLLRLAHPRPAHGT